MRSSLDLGENYPTDISSLQSEYSCYYPINQISDDTTPISFVVPSSSIHYVQFNDSFVYLKLKIVSSTGATLTATDVVAGSFDLLSSIFSGIEIDMNGCLVSKTATLLPYRSHILKLLTRDKGYKDTIATSEFWYPDTKANTFDTDNSVFTTRAAFSTASAPFEILGRLSESIFETPKYFPPQINTKILLRRSASEFCLDTSVTTTKYKLSISECVLYVRRHVVHPSVIAYHHKLLSSNRKFQYPLKQFEIRTFNLAVGTSSTL